MTESVQGISPAAWAQKAGQGQWRQATSEQSGIAELLTLLNGEKSPEEVARGVAAIYEPHIDHVKNSMGYIVKFWEIFCEAVREFGGSYEQAQRLANFLQSLAGLPDVKADFERQMYWRDLPGFNIMFRQSGLTEVYSDTCESFPTQHRTISQLC